MSYMCPNFTTEETPETVPVLLAGAVPMVSPDAGMADVVESFLTSQIPNKKTARGYRRHILAAMDMMGVEKFSQLQPVHLMNYRSELMADTRGMATHAQALIALRSFLTWGAALRGHDMSMDQALYLLKVPKVTVITPHDTLSAEEIIRYLDAAKRSGPRDLALVIVALGSGVRVAELCAIDIKDIRTDASGGTTIHVRQGKGSKDRMIPVRPEVGKAVDAYLKATMRQRGDGGALFLPEDRAMGSRDTWRLTTKSASRTVKWLADQAGIKKRISPTLCATRSPSPATCIAGTSWRSRNSWVTRLSPQPRGIVPTWMTSICARLHLHPSLVASATRSPRSSPPSLHVNSVQKGPP